MNPEEQLDFTDDLINNVHKGIRDQLIRNKLSITNWDGFELRQYIADKFKEACFAKMQRLRRNDFNNTVIVNNM